MNICIITVYNTENCGSFWQAYALAETLKKMGHKVSFLYRDLKGTSQSLSECVRLSLLKCVKLDFKAAALIWSRVNNYKKAQKLFDVITEDSDEFKSIDYFVLGSDTIWNFALPYFAKNKRKYTGGKFGSDRCITYAASAANTPCEMFENDPVIAEDIAKLKAISVRDYDTWKIVKKITGRDADIVCDPTMLAEREVFDKHITDIPDDKYILIYHFANISDNAKAEIIELKKKHGLKIVTFGQHRAWCDKTVAYDPYKFVSYMKNASFVITDTFHGTIFSILYERNFAEYGYRKKKIANLLKTLELEAAIKEDSLCLDDMYQKSLDYSKARERIVSLRAKSLNYLKQNITEK